MAKTHLNRYKEVLAFIAKCLKPYKIYIISTLILMLFARSAGRFAEAYMIKRVVDTISNQTPSEILVNQLLFLTFAYAGVQLLVLVASRANYIFSGYAYIQMTNIIYKKCMDKLNYLSYDFFENNMSGSILAKIKRFVSSATSICHNLHYKVYRAFSIVFISIIGLAYIDLRLGLALLLFIGVFTLATTLITSHFSNIFSEQAKKQSILTGSLVDKITNILTIKTFGKNKQEANDFSIEVDEYTDALFQETKINEIINGLQILFMIIIEVIVWLVLIQGWQQGNIQAGDMAFVQSLLFASFHKLWGIGSVLLNINTSVYNATEMIDIFNTKSSLDLKPNPSTDFQIQKGEFSINNLNFSYNQEVEVFKNLNLQILSSQKVGIVGHSGSGKSTLIKLLLRLMDPQEGSIQCDNTDLKQIDLDTYRSQISYVPQQPMLFHRSILDNIRYANPDAAQGQIIEVAKKAHVHEFVSKLPQGYDSLVGERGIKLSGGERQRIAIARAMLEPNKILILDEATSALDSISEKFIQDSFQELMKDRTTIVIAHRLSTIQQLDRIIVFNQGRIIEDGAHQELLAKKGHYYELWSHQNEGFIQD